MSVKAKMYSEKAHARLYHILDEFETSHRGIQNLKGIIPDDQYMELLEKNSEQLIHRIMLFRQQEQILNNA